ncbi:MazF family transcriptional regulator [Desulforamulus profundi]|uniref:MazF family transcriptional regulator n=1 Tax=Desulforamulus profundi TaxID=1383067 RepID=A0A2C6MB94_9FIRM|nr:MazF family transcriptional regulator [Desulforamulus profundi]
MVIAKISFSEANSGNAKVRPVLVISTESHNKNRNDLVVLKISSKSISDARWEIVIRDAKQTGLKIPSKIVCDGVKTVCKEDVRFIGRLDRLTLKKVKKNLENLLFGD